MARKGRVGWDSIKVKLIILSEAKNLYCNSILNLATLYPTHSYTISYKTNAEVLMHPFLLGKYLPLSFSNRAYTPPLYIKT